MSKLLEVSHVNILGDDKIILQDITFSLNLGELLVIIGPNGAGKSTLIKTIAGLIMPNSGNIKWQVAPCIGYMPQKLQISPMIPISVKKFLSLSQQGSLRTLEEVILQVGIEKILLNAMQTLSQGELQRVLLARALLNAANLLLLDEPVEGLDITGIAAFYRLLHDLRLKQPIAVIMVSHDLRFVMAGSDKVICLNRHICCQGIASDIRRHEEFIRLFGEDVAIQMALYSHRHDHEHL